MGLFDTLGNLASRGMRELGKGVGALGQFAGNVAGGAWSSFTDPGFNLPTTGGLAGKIGGLIGEFGETLFPSSGTPMDPGPWGGAPGYPIGINPDARAQRDLEIFLGQTGGYPLPGTAPQEMEIPFEFGERTTQPIMRAPGGGWMPDPTGGGAQPMMTNVALPGGALIGQVLRQIPGVLGGAVLGYGAGQEGGGQSLALPYGGMMFRPTTAGIRARSLVEVTNPISGKKSWYRNVGRPILFSGDLRACRRVRKIAGRARRARGR